MSCLRIGSTFSLIRIGQHAFTRCSLCPNRFISTTPAMNSITQDLKKVIDAPRPALFLGLAGLIPFMSAPVYMLNSGFLLPDIVLAQHAYGATILSFLGGVRWGLLVKGGSDSLPPSWQQYSWSVTPSLIAWASLLTNEVVGITTCSVGLALAAYLDINNSGYPSWFRGLRIILTTGAVISLLGMTPNLNHQNIYTTDIQQG